jgi:hypothetical protein
LPVAPVNGLAVPVWPHKVNADVAVVEFPPGPPRPIVEYLLAFLRDPVFDQSLEIVPRVAAF